MPYLASDNGRTCCLDGSPRMLVRSNTSPRCILCANETHTPRKRSCLAKGMYKHRGFVMRYGLLTSWLVLLSVCGWVSLKSPVFLRGHTEYNRAHVKDMRPPAGTPNSSITSLFASSYCDTTYRNAFHSTRTICYCKYRYLQRRPNQQSRYGIIS